MSAITETQKSRFTFQFSEDHRFVKFQQGELVNAAFTGSNHPKEGDTISWEAGNMSGKATVEAVKKERGKDICSIRILRCKDHRAGKSARQFAW